MEEPDGTGHRPHRTAGHGVSLCAMARLTCIALIVLAVFASAAAAAPPWSAPQTVSSASLFVDSPDVVFAADGRAIATWRWSGPKPAQGNAPGGTRLAVREPGALDFGPERSAPNFVTPLITYGLDRVLGLDTRRRSRGRISLRARFGNSQGGFGPPRTISTFGGHRVPAVAGRPERRARGVDRQVVTRPPHRACRDQVARALPAARSRCAAAAARTTSWRARRSA